LAYSTATLRAARRVRGAPSSGPIRSSCQRQSRIIPSRTWRLSARAFSRSRPASSSSSDTRQQALTLRRSPSAMLLLPPEGHAQPLLVEGRAFQRARGQRARQQQVAALIIHLDDQLLTVRPDLDLVLLREGQADVERVARALLLHLHRLLAEEDLRGVLLA